MITIAYLVGAESPATTIAGLPVLLRQALSLQDAGIDLLIHSDWLNDAETRELFASDVMPRFR